jgi:hypothetical protein
MLKPLREEQADMKARWSDPSYRWANDSNLRRQFHAYRKQAIPDTVHEVGHNVEQPLCSSGAEVEIKGEPK